MLDSQSNYTYRASPQLSANQIAEYLSATPGRRKSIIQEARFPKTSQRARYRGARDCLSAFLCDGTRSFNHIAKALDHLKGRAAKPMATDWVKEDSQLSVEAIEAFQRSYNRLGLPAVECAALPRRLPPLVFAKTKINVHLDVVARRKNLHGPDAIGGAIFVFSRGEKAEKKRVERCKTIAGLAYDFCVERLSGMGQADTSICLGVDVFGQRSYPPPGTFAKKRKQIEDCCEEIYARWWSIDPPLDYDGPDFSEP